MFDGLHNSDVPLQSSTAKDWEVFLLTDHDDHGAFTLDVSGGSFLLIPTETAVGESVISVAQMLHKESVTRD